MASLPWTATIHLANLSLILGLTTVSRFLRLYIWLPLTLLILLHIYLYTALPAANALDRLRPASAAFGVALRAVELLLCSEPQRDFRRDGEAKLPSGFFGRLRWAFGLLLTQRGVGWNWRVKNTPPSPTSSRPVFLFGATIRALAFYLFLDVLDIFIHRIGLEYTLLGPLSLVHGIALWGSISLHYEYGCIALVALGVSSPADCPSLWGGLAGMRTIRGFWGESWHQCLRRPFTVIPRYILSSLGLKPRTSMSAAFLLSAIFHMANSYATSSGKRFIGTILFFISQRCGIFFEDVLGISRWPAWLGYLWVFSWFSIVGPLWFSDMVHGGFYDEAERLVPVSLVSKLLM